MVPRKTMEYQVVSEHGRVTLELPSDQHASTMDNGGEVAEMKNTQADTNVDLGV
jgi:hypothetical protein